MGFEAGWITNPPYPGRPKVKKALPAYEKDDTGGLGAASDNDLGASFDYGFIEVDPEAWLEGPDRTLYVCGSYQGLMEYWIERGALGDPAYKATAASIGESYAAEAEALLPFWESRRAEYEPGERGDQTVTLGRILKGIDDTGQQVTVPPGTYLCRGTESRQIPGETQLSPFSVSITVGGKSVLINPDTLSGYVDEHVVEAKSLGLANTLKAETIRALFAETKSLISAYVPQDEWLQDEHVHYVTSDEMGAVFVLEKMPASAEAVEEARRKDDDFFEYGANTPGVCFGDHIFIQLDQLGIGVEYHEAVHSLAHPATLKILGWGFNEGATEYFTRMLVAGAGDSHKLVRPKEQYQSEREGVEALIDLGVFTAEDLAKAYFAGQMQALFAKAAQRLGKGFSLQAYALHLQGGYASAARQTLQGLLSH
ncbi:hypothetical protein [Microbispora catharanthi]|uniref:Uncharacterized protein n=1 Tax=Microbispora catharanthi TaxID=1712871 RepID=A0A5N6BVR1_9ACTN|nr:hypothetical protein [Microbispora catharanthi]KAB8184531.1 hypothetical protein FH610_015645 [Microbispora catharanthi]